MIFKEWFSIIDQMEGLERWILVHGYIYYEENDNIVSDHKYDSNAVQLLTMIERHPDAFKDTRYYPYFKTFEPGCTSSFEILQCVKVQNPKLYSDIKKDALWAIENHYNKPYIKPLNNTILYPSQQEALKHLKYNSAKGYHSILNGRVGSGKSITSLYYYFDKCGGAVYKENYIPMTKPKNLYIITTAQKRDRLEWEKEMIPFLLSTDKSRMRYDIEVKVDSWNNIEKYSDIKDSFFIFDEQKVIGYKKWARTFIYISKNNDWILLSATPGDKWEDYISVFIANGFYRNKTDFVDQHIVYASCVTYPKIEKYLDVDTLIRHRDSLLVDIKCEKYNERVENDILVEYDKKLYTDTIKTLWDPYKDEYIPTGSVLSFVLRKITNSSEDRVVKLLEILEDHPKSIIFYNYDYELDILLNIIYPEGTEVAQWNGHKHEPIPNSKKWVYLVQYTSGCEGWNCIETDTIIFYSQNSAYRVVEQAKGRIDRLNTPFTKLYYYTLRSGSHVDLSIKKALKNKKKFNESAYGNKIFERRKTNG